MSASGHSLLDSLLEELGLDGAAQKIGEQMVRFRFGSATVIAAVAGQSLVIQAPMFKELPPSQHLEFCRHLLALNAKMSGLASFALTPEGSVSLVAGRAIEGLDAGEFRMLLNTVGKFADDFDDLLDEQYYAVE